ncbi:uncharacterized protein F4807DRAFT_355840 [Annulohypoxylon truncatum]|uniref:uncharacterized protein n=1 Tax=Annulohypoxylon truncatum TaxID=327061 RepID=UPI0020073E36|nr:uncharacterized protein F4807DRAFT_355840 [Annulohypoxylon truncatum]KAI1204281.1 hypothetical protein F4807DRAFT_355840 [Annulohypoxylon truncatum]
MSRYNQLSDGRYVCKFHGLVTCSSSTCDSDFSVYNYMMKLPMNRFQHELETLDPWFRASLARAIEAIDRGRPIVRPTSGTPPPSDLGPLSMDRITIDPHDPETQLLIPKLFFPPSLTSLPSDLFESTPIQNVRRTTRFVHRQDPKQLIVFAGAICLRQVTHSPRTGWAFWFRNNISNLKPATIGNHLEAVKDGRSMIPKTQDRVDVRVLVAILQCRRWAGEGFNTLVIATSSDYVIRVITVQLREWLSSDWRRPRREQLTPNRDLWQIFLSEVDNCKSEGLEVKIWQVPKPITEIVDLRAERVALGR